MSGLLCTLVIVKLVFLIIVFKGKIRKGGEGLRDGFFAAKGRSMLDLCSDKVLLG
jgi:hypothetical protein